MSKTQSTVTFTPAILGLLKQYAANSSEYKSSFAIVRQDAFVFGFQANIFGEDFNHFEKWQILSCFESVERLFSFCDSAIKHAKAFTEKEITNLVSIFSNLKTTKDEDERFSDYELLEECFGTTEFWKWLAIDCRNEFSETIACLNLHEWLQGLIDELRVIAK